MSASRSEKPCSRLADDHKMYAEVYQKHIPLLTHILEKRCKPWAEDLAHEAILKVAYSPYKEEDVEFFLKEGEEKFKERLLKSKFINAAIKLSIDWWRKRGNHHVAFDESFDFGSEQVKWEYKHDLEVAQGSLTEIEKTCVRMFWIEGKPYEEIIDELGKSETAVANILFRAKKKMVQVLSKDGYAEVMPKRRVNDANKSHHISDTSEKTSTGTNENTRLKATAEVE